MKTIARFTFAVALVASAVLLAPNANAQTLIKGQFEMPVQAQWGQMVLPPGHYALAIQTTLSGNRFLRLEGPSGSQSRLLSAFSIPKNHVASYLKLERFGNRYAVREFSVGPSGVIYTFRAPKELTSEAKSGAPSGLNTAATLVRISAH